MGAGNQRDLRAFVFAAYFIICMAIVGGVIIRRAAGQAADLWGLRPALTVPACCYLGIFSFALYARRSPKEV